MKRCSQMSVTFQILQENAVSFHGWVFFLVFLDPSDCKALVCSVFTLYMNLALVICSMFMSHCATSLEMISVSNVLAFMSRAGLSNTIWLTFYAILILSYFVFFLCWSAEISMFMLLYLHDIVGLQWWTPTQPGIFILFNILSLDTYNLVSDFTNRLIYSQMCINISINFNLLLLWIFNLF